MTPIRGSARRNPALFGYILSALIFTVLIYALLFHVRDNQVSSCERVNVIRRELNARRITANKLIHLENLEHPRIHLRPYHSIPTVNCQAAFDKPWPFS